MVVLSSWLENIVLGCLGVGRLEILKEVHCTNANYQNNDTYNLINVQLVIAIGMIGVHIYMFPIP